MMKCFVGGYNIKGTTPKASYLKLNHKLNLLGLLVQVSSFTRITTLYQISASFLVTALVPSRVYNEDGWHNFLGNIDCESSSQVAGELTRLLHTHLALFLAIISWLIFLSLVIETVSVSGIIVTVKYSKGRVCIWFNAKYLSERVVIFVIYCRLH